MEEEEERKKKEEEEAKKKKEEENRFNVNRDIAKAAKDTEWDVEIIVDDREFDEEKHKEYLSKFLIHEEPKKKKKEISNPPTESE